MIGRAPERRRSHASLGGDVLDLPRRDVEDAHTLVELLGGDERHAPAVAGDRRRLAPTGRAPAGVHWLRTFMRRFAEQGHTILLASHVLAEVAQTVDQVLIIDRGRLLANARLDELAGRGRTLEDAYLEVTAGEAP